MQLLAVNLSGPRTIDWCGAPHTTTLFKTRARDRVMLGINGFEGDGVPGRSPDEAAFVYAAEHYNQWMRALDRDDFVAGQFGESLTVEGLLEGTVQIGDIFKIGDARVQVSQPRDATEELSVRMNFENFAETLNSSKMSGFYIRVLEAGEVGAGDAIELEHREEDGMTVLEVFELLRIDRRNLPGALRALELPTLAEPWKGWFRERLTEAGML